MLHLDARQVLSMTRDELDQYPQQLVTLTFDDGVLVSGWHATIFSWYLWEFHRRYPDTPLLMKHHIGNARTNKGTHIKTANQCFWDTYEAYGRQLDVEDLCKVTYELTQMLFNDVERIEEYSVTLSADDFMEIIDHPEIAAINAGLTPTEHSISQGYKDITKILKDETQLRSNRLANAIKSDLVKLGQALQCVSARGYLTDLDSHRFDNPIMDSYTAGIYDLHDSAIESRSATKSLVFNKELIKATEYFNREMQLLCQVMLGLLPGDCGTTRMLPVRIRNTDDLRYMDGKHFITEGGLKTIRPWSKELIGQKVSIRAVSCCETTRRGFICETCFGELSLSVPHRTNIGHVSATEVCRNITQKVLSNKHLDQSSMIERIVLDSHDSHFMKVMKCGSKLGLADDLHGLPVSITFDRTCTPYLADVRSTEDIPEHSLPRYSQISAVTFNVLRKGGIMQSASCHVAIGSRIGYFTVAFLNHIRNVGWSQTSTGDYQVTLEGWDAKRPIFALPMKQMNMLDFKQEAEGRIKRSKRYPAGKSSPNLNDPEVMAAEIIGLYDLLNTRVNTNFAHVEVMLQATLIVSEEHRDYRIPLPTENREFGRFNDIIKYRSMSGAMAHEKQADTLNNYTSYLITDRSPLPYDSFISTRERTYQF